MGASVPEMLRPDRRADILSVNLSALDAIDARGTRSVRHTLLYPDSGDGINANATRVHDMVCKRLTTDNTDGTDSKGICISSSSVLSVISVVGLCLLSNRVVRPCDDY